MREDTSGLAKQRRMEMEKPCSEVERQDAIWIQFEFSLNFALEIKFISFL